jgi:ketosteroid isomerase-like protein
MKATRQTAAFRRSGRRAATSRGRDRGALLLAASGAGGALAARALVSRVLLLKLRRDVRALNAGDIEPVLASFAPDAVLRFNDGEHRWAGEHRGEAAIALFLRNCAAAGLQGQITELFMAGPPWRMTLLARFDDHAHEPGGEEIYRNRTILLARTRWGRIVCQEDFYEDTQRILALETRLSELGVHQRV